MERERVFPMKSILAPGNDMGPRDDAEFLRPGDACKTHEVVNGGLILARRELGGSTVRHRWRRSPPFSNTSARKTPSPITRSKASSGRGVRVAKAKRRRLATTRPGELLAAPGGDSLKDKRDRAILSTLLYHALRRDELCKLARSNETSGFYT
jgi:integrase